MHRVADLVEQIRRSRRYTVGLLEAIPRDDWFRMPAEGVSHVAWQVGHLAMANYRLALHRVRGIQVGDDDLIAPEFLARFARTSTPDADPSSYPSADEIRSVFDHVHARVLAELAELPDSALGEPVVLPHPLCTTKADALSWCALHEAVHAGQIGLLRRLIGHLPVW